MKSKPSRYKRVSDEIRIQRAANVLEIGTWNGDRALEFAEAALSANVKKFNYVGFDLFEDMTPEKSREEFNVKSPTNLNAVQTKLDTWAKTKPIPMTFTLIKGNTRRTLPTFLLEYGPGIFDLAWIDGGHSVETIESDWDICAKLVKPDGLVLLDDFYELLPDADATKFYGCNRLVHSLMSAGRDVFIFPEMDPVRGGGFTKAVRIRI